MLRKSRCVQIFLEIQLFVLLREICPHLAINSSKNLTPLYLKENLNAS